MEEYWFINIRKLVHNF